MHFFLQFLFGRAKNKRRHFNKDVGSLAPVDRPTTKHNTSVPWYSEFVTDAQLRLAPIQQSETLRQQSLRKDFHLMLRNRTLLLGPLQDISRRNDRKKARIQKALHLMLRIDRKSTRLNSSHI